MVQHSSREPTTHQSVSGIYQTKPAFKKPFHHTDNEAKRECSQWHGETMKWRDQLELTVLSNYMSSNNCCNSAIICSFWPKSHVGGFMIYHIAWIYLGRFIIIVLLDIHVGWLLNIIHSSLPSKSLFSSTWLDPIISNDPVLFPSASCLVSAVFSFTYYRSCFP